MDALAKAKALEARHRKPPEPAPVGADGYPSALCQVHGQGHYFRQQREGARWYATCCALRREPDDPLPGGVETLTVAPEMADPRRGYSHTQESAVNPPFLGENGHPLKRRLVPPFADAQDYSCPDRSNNA